MAFVAREQLEKELCLFDRCGAGICSGWIEGLGSTFGSAHFHNMLYTISSTFME